MDKYTKTRTSSSQRNPGLTVFYDGSCPLCAREIAFYKNQKSADSIIWHDVSLAAGCLPSNLSRTEALRRFHVRLPDGKLVSGAAAFSALWQALPRFRVLGNVAGMPVLRTIAEWGYQLFLFLRPRLQTCLRFLRTQPR